MRLFMEMRYLNSDLDTSIFLRYLNFARGTSILLEVPHFCDTSMRYYLTVFYTCFLKFSPAARQTFKIFACDAPKPQNFRLRRAKTSKFSPAARPNLKIFACGAPKPQILACGATKPKNFACGAPKPRNFRLRRITISKFLPKVP